jgi:ribosome assembly protein 1
MSNYNINLFELNKAIYTGFDLATRSGPLCEEPMIGVVYIVESFEIVQNKLEKTEIDQKNLNQ